MAVVGNAAVHLDILWSTAASTMPTTTPNQCARDPSGARTRLALLHRPPRRRGVSAIRAGAASLEQTDAAGSARRARRERVGQLGEDGDDLGALSRQLGARVEQLGDVRLASAEPSRSIGAATRSRATTAPGQDVTHELTFASRESGVAPMGRHEVGPLRGMCSVKDLRRCRLAEASRRRRARARARRSLSVAAVPGGGRAADGAGSASAAG